MLDRRFLSRKAPANVAKKDGLPMTEPKPPMPKRPYTRKALPKPSIKPVGARKQDEIDLDATLLGLDQLGCIVMATEWGREEAAVRLGWTVDRVQECLMLPQSRLMLQRIQEQLVQKMVNAKFHSLVKTGVTRADMENRLMQIAMMDPAETKGTVMGQVEALKTLADKFGYAKKDDPLEKMTPDELKQIVKRSADRMIEGTVQ
jgi:hypothetical protein